VDGESYRGQSHRGGNKGKKKKKSWQKNDCRVFTCIYRHLPLSTTQFSRKIESRVISLCLVFQKKKKKKKQKHTLCILHIFTLTSKLRAGWGQVGAKLWARGYNWWYKRGYFSEEKALSPTEGIRSLPSHMLSFQVRPPLFSEGGGCW